MVKTAQPSFQQLDITLSEIYDAMGYTEGVLPDPVIVGIVESVLHETAMIVKPRYMYRWLPATLHGGGVVNIGGTQFTTGRIITSYLSGITDACVFIGTAGLEYEDYLHQLKHEGDIIKEFVADSIGSVIAEKCVSLISAELDTLLPDQKHTLPYSPGYCGWNISEQKLLFSIMPDSTGCGVTLSDSFLMNPIKSVSGFIGIGTEIKPQPYKCQICANPHCYKRKLKNHNIITHE